MAESKIEIGKKTVNPNVFKKPDTTFDAGNPTAAQYVAERRAYAILRATGNGVCGAGEEKIESEKVSTSPYESILSGPRLVPPPSLTSVDWSTDAANDIIDAYLWKATVSFTCYSPEDFAKLDTSFFRHLNQVELTLGWLSSKENSSVKIYGNIVDYQFSINEKLHYDCSVTFAGAHIQSAAAFNTAAKSPGNTKLKFGQTDNTAGFEIVPQSIVGILRAEAEALFGVTIPENEANANNTSQQTTSTNSQTTTTSNGEITGKGGGLAQGNGSFSKATITIPDSSWITYIPFTSGVQEKEFFYVSLTKLIQTINDNISTNDNFKGFLYFIPPDSVTKLTHNLCKSANPTSLINGWSAVYSGTLDLSPGAQDFFICLSELERIEEEIRRDKSDTPHLTKKSILQFFKKVCGIINENLGNAVQMEVIPYNQVGDEENGQLYGYEITDRKTVIKSSISHTVVNPLELGSLVRSISVQSTTDSEMAAIALSAAQNGGEGGSATIIKGGLFGCSDNTEDAVIAPVNVSKEADAKYSAKPGETKGVGTAVAGDDGKPIIAKYMVATSGIESTSSPTAYTNTVNQANQTAKTNDAQKTPEAQLTEMFAAYSVFDSAVVSDTLVIMKKIWAKNPGTISGYSYGVTVTITVDGYAENLFGQTFRVTGLPSMLTSKNVYFVVLKQGHKFSNGDWTMDLEGQMMFDFNGKISKNPDIAKGITYTPSQGGTGNVVGKTGNFAVTPKGSQIRTPCGVANINSPFMTVRFQGRTHWGYDYNCPQGTPLYSPFKCKVVVAANAAGSCGGMVSLHCYNDKGEPNYALIHCHLQNIYVKVGDMIERGKVYARSGGGQSDASRGRSGGPHLHLEIYKAPFSGFETFAGGGRGNTTREERFKYVVTDHSIMNGWNFGIGYEPPSKNPSPNEQNTRPNIDFVKNRNVPYG